ncbi:MAG: hypothetical protein BWK80_56465 [Desulfobacteraceae bacterium IS3]|nr:MAG: hypothetical protein BWK80_56465 [Desulfobacteraceae bacterium IS3]HAO21479.1 DUF2809 domain-containing protein [Desulfobacteraceae bacterium]
MIISAYSRHIRIVISLAILIPVGFYTKFYKGPLAQWLNASSGGVFYEIFWCLLIFLFAEIRPVIIALSVLITTCCLEFLQLWHPPILEWLRSFFIGRTILGTTFDGWDFPYYFIGSGIGWLWMKALCSIKD